MKNILFFVVLSCLCSFLLGCSGSQSEAASPVAARNNSMATTTEVPARQPATTQPVAKVVKTVIRTDIDSIKNDGEQIEINLNEADNALNNLAKSFNIIIDKLAVTETARNKVAADVGRAIIAIETARKTIDLIRLRVKKINTKIDFHNESMSGETRSDSDYMFILILILINILLMFVLVVSHYKLIYKFILKILGRDG